MKKLLIPFFLIFAAITLTACSYDDRSIVIMLDDEKANESDLQDLAFTLHQNYPNPFNPSTTIRYDLRERMNVKLKVMTDDWQTVETLLSGTQSQGYYSINFSANNLASGDYFYTLEGRNYTLVRKMKLVK
jgi:hypothetical protein